MSTTTTMTTTVDPHVGPYTLIRSLGSGGMGEVHLAFDAKLRRHIALKRLPAGVATDEALMNRLRREARLASSLNHPNIITIYDIAEEGDSVYVAMEHIEGKTLREILEDGPLPVRKTISLAVQIAEGLAAAHRRDVVHRDLKPENVMVTTDGIVKILDFGLAKSVPPPFPDSRTTSMDSLEGSIAGTCSYMSPEQARGQLADYRSDQFSFGSMLYELLTGRKPFEAESAVETLFTIVRDEPVPLSVAAPHVPPPLRWCIDRCLAKHAEDRYASTHDLARDLRDLRDHFSEAALRPVAAEPVAPQNAFRWKPFVGAGLFLLAGGITAGFFGERLLHKPQPHPITSFTHLTYSGVDYSPAVAPDRNTIAFSSLRDGKQRIWLKQLRGGTEAVLTEGPGDDFPRFSPDGATILFRGPGENQSRGALYRVATLGGEKRKVADDATSGDWSPDGRRIAFTRASANADSMGSLYVTSADGGDVRLLAVYPLMTVIHPRWSPDGGRIAVVGARGRSPQYALIVDAATGKTRTLNTPRNAGEISSIVWSPDGRSLLYSRRNSVEAVVGTSATIFRHDLESDLATPVAWTPTNAAVLDQLAPGQMVFDSRSPKVNLHEIPLTPDAGEPRWVTRGNSSDRQPVYTPDGQSILFSSNRSGNLDLWQLEPGTGVVRRLTDDKAEDWDPAYTKDGRILWSSSRSGNLEIWTADADGSNARQLTRDGVDAENPTATPDGRWIVYNSFHPEKEGVWRINADGTSPIQLVNGRTALPEVSPDGQYVAYIEGNRTLNPKVRVARLSDGTDMGFEVSARPRLRTSAILGRARWMPDSKAIAWLAQSENGVNGVFVQDFVPGRDTTSTRRALGGFDRDRVTESFGISPDGKRISVAAWEQLFGVMIVNGLPESLE